MEEREDDVQDGASKSRKRAVNVQTVEKWVMENDKKLDTLLWLKFTKDWRDS